MLQCARGNDDLRVTDVVGNDEKRNFGSDTRARRDVGQVSLVTTLEPIPPASVAR